MGDEGFWTDKAILVLAITAIIAFLSAPAIMAAISVTATIANTAPAVGRIRICPSAGSDAGTCVLTTTMPPATTFTLEITLTESNGQYDINTETFRVTMFHATDSNTSAESWDVNAMTMADDNLWLGSANGCSQNVPPQALTGTYCLNIPDSAWSTKFLYGDTSFYVAVDDNSNAFDSNSVDHNFLFTSYILNRSEDTTSGTYGAALAPGMAGNPLTSDQTSNNYIRTTHNGNRSIDVNVNASDLNVSAVLFIGDDNQWWALIDSNAVGDATRYTGGFDAVRSDLNRGVYPTRGTFDLYNWLDVPKATLPGTYSGTLTYGAKKS